MCSKELDQQRHLGTTHSKSIDCALANVLDTSDEVAGTLRRAVRRCSFILILGERRMECAYYIEFCRLLIPKETVL